MTQAGELRRLVNRLASFAGTAGGTADAVPPSAPMRRPAANHPAAPASASPGFQRSGPWSQATLVTEEDDPDFRPF
jgi:hypothetical protein